MSSAVNNQNLKDNLELLAKKAFALYKSVVNHRMVGGEVTLSTANPEPCMKVSLHTALQCMVI